MVITTVCDHDSRILHARLKNQLLLNKILINLNKKNIKSPNQNRPKLKWKNKIENRNERKGITIEFVK